MNCREAIELLATHPDDAPSPASGWRFKLHLWCCRNCRNYLATYRATIRLEKSAARDAEDHTTTVPEELISRIMSAVREGSGFQA